MTAQASEMFLFEIGTEEIPAFDLHKATIQLEKIVSQLFEARAIAHGDVAIFSTPRRLIVQVSDVATATEEKHELIKGPSAAIAFDEAGNLTKAGVGFARSKNVLPEDIEVRDENGTSYIFARKDTPSMQVISLLPEIAQDIIESISWPKSQRWGIRSEHFSRPIRWFVALFGNEIVPFEYAGITAGNVTYGHRFLDSAPQEIASASDFIGALSKMHVVVSEQEREACIRAQIKEIEHECGLVADIPEKIMAEVVNLTEYPTVMKGQFKDLFLSVPSEIIVDAMLVHQRYFPLYTSEGKLTNSFLITSNGNPEYREYIVDGNQRVVDARLYDAKFFYDEDLKQPLEAYLEKLETVVFQEKLGTMLSKVSRMEKLAAHIVSQLNLSADEVHDIERAVHLAKADLVTSAVVEFTSVQGVMGDYYAKAAGENGRVAQAISQHYKPRFAGDSIPDTIVGIVVALVDKLDTICGMFAIDQAPTGSSDPFALRRFALGILAMLPQCTLSLEQAIEASLDLYAQQGLVFDKAHVTNQIIEFFVTRTKVSCKDEGISVDVIDAVLATGITEPFEIVERIHTLDTMRNNQPDLFDDLATAYARAHNLGNPELGTVVDASCFGADEQNFYDALMQAQDNVTQALERNDFNTALVALSQLRTPVDIFFENVMIMDDDLTIQKNRISLLNTFVQLCTPIADFAKMAKIKK
ncbi:MAG: glycine--tRNA ligase subunit beta [Eggerthellaceae bacterium]|nr:glycine--tRNA ligase subunit beta [Eggerthellaceae bacterium]